MTSLLNNKIGSHLSGWFTALAFLLAFSVNGQDIPKANGYVTDQAGVFSPDERERLESSLRALNDSTSNQVAIYTTNDLQGYDKADVALKYLRENGVGQTKTNNGVVILIKPKTAEAKGEVFIEVGYGLEGAIPDAIAKRIVENEMIPAFKQGNYYAGAAAAVLTVSKLASGEIKAANYGAQKAKSKGGTGAGIVILIIVVFVVVALSGNRRYASRNNLPFWLALGLFNSVGSRHSGSWNNFSGGSGGGGFGGFGGGSGGGGGAGGSW
ncbi:MAG: TPM domain-containing protein [Bacteroidota bacterium]